MSTTGLLYQSTNLWGNQLCGPLHRVLCAEDACTRTCALKCVMPAQVKRELDV